MVEPTYLYEYPNWTHFTWDNGAILEPLTRAVALQGKLLGRMEQFGFDVRQDTEFHQLTEEIIRSSEIEGEILNAEQVRSSIARHLGINFENGVHPSHHIDGVVQMMLDVMHNFASDLTEERLFGWHAALFPTGHSGYFKIAVARYRDDADGPMQVVSQKARDTVVHYRAPDAPQVPGMMSGFLDWVNHSTNTHPLIKAAISHLWFVTIHPFDDGNGRIARAVTDMLLARADDTSLRFYSMSSQIQKEKKGYYDILEHSQKGTSDITGWLNWFLICLAHSIESAGLVIDRIARKAVFWRENALLVRDERQRKIINMLFDGFDGHLTSSKFEKIVKCSQDTAGRLLKDLAGKGILVQEGAGRSTHYVLAVKAPK
ncbi:Fic family protein [Leadbettera azotonutricia]|uniref:Filamentation induced by cAMP protein Fic n=1 Tax=Leadbettera azotonutricia (strain ATCC BAA-888 / DSM 13862 / ZAS-9) TaxID=545695 RepID=F5YAJ5_LEAAZ|nr:Fic family protein [Leadbettera azotonutricia]AEF82138.1 filamentation induced by cAMP protein Fic [Leadbettera azotonutricia ZAS-9]